MTFDFEERQGELFESITPNDSIVLGISEDLKLGSKGNKLSLYELREKEVELTETTQIRHQWCFSSTFWKPIITTSSPKKDCRSSSIHPSSSTTKEIYLLFDYTTKIIQQTKLC